MSTIANLTVALNADVGGFTGTMASATRSINAFKKMGADVYKQTRTPLEQFEAAQKRINALFHGGQIDAETHRRAIARLGDEYRRTAQDASLLSRVSKSVGGIGGAAATLGIGLGVGELISLTKSSYQAFADAEKQQQTLAAVLESTGHAAGFTKDALNNMATALERVTNFDDDAIAGMQAVLATFTQIKGLQFTDATKAILNISTVLDQDVKSSAVQVGKALNDPIRGMTALRRVGVSFTEQQVDMVKQMVAANDIIGAQKLILRELETEFGGAAEKVRNELTGLTNDWSNFQEAVGSFAQTDAAISFTEKLSNAVRNLTDSVNGAKAAAESESSFGDKVLGLLEARKLLPQLTLGSPLSMFSRGPDVAPPTKPDVPKKPDAAKAQLAAAKEAAKDAAKLSEAVEKLQADVQKQIDTFGLSAAEIKLWELAQRGATEAELAQIRTDMQAIENIQSLTAKEKENRTAREAVTKAVDDHVKAIENELRMIGKTADEQERLRLATQGATDAQLRQVEAMQKQLATAEFFSQAGKEATERAEAANKAAEAAKAATKQKQSDHVKEIVERQKPQGLRDAERHAKELKDLEAVKDQLTDAQYREERSRLNKDFVRGYGDKPRPGASSNPALVAGTSQFYSAISRSTGGAGQVAPDSKAQRQMLAIQKRQEVIDRNLLAESKKKKVANF